MHGHADMYEQRIDHSSHYAGRIDRTNGRVYRLAAKDMKPAVGFDYSAFDGPRLVRRLEHPNKWHRQTALRVLGDRGDASLIPLLVERTRAALAPRP